MARRGNRIIIRLTNKKTGTTYTTTRNRVNTTEKLKIKKFDKKTKKHELFEETKVK